jgi:hypothetical protein
VPLLYRWPAAARGIGVDDASCEKAIHRVSHYPTLWVRRVALWLMWPVERQAKGRPRCTVRGCDVPERSSRGVVTCASPGTTLVCWGCTRVVTTGWRRVVTTRLAQQCWGRVRAKLQQWRLGGCRYGSASSTGAGQTLRVSSLTCISRPCGHRFSGDLTGFGRCVTGINRADTASVKSNAPMLRHPFVVCNGSGEAETGSRLWTRVHGLAQVSALLTVALTRTVRNVTRRHLFYGVPYHR